MKLDPLKLSLAMASMLVLSLAGCGGGGGGGSSTPMPPVTPTTTISVYPSLGKFSSGTQVVIQQPNGTMLGSGTVTDSTGVAAVPIPASYSGPMLVQVTGSGTVTYYDEGTGGNVPFTGGALSALTPAVQTPVGVTMATNAAVANLKAQNSGALPSSITGDQVNNANAQVQTALGITNILVAPTLVDSNTKASLQLGSANDQYALQLAALAKLAASGKNALTVASDLATDIAAGSLNQQAGTTTQFTQTAVSSSLTTVAATLATPTTASAIAANPTIVGTVSSGNITAVTAPTGTDTVALQQAKSMFSQLRTTLYSIANGHTGFLDAEALTMSKDIQANIAPNLVLVATRMDAMSTALDMFDMLAANSTNLTLGYNLLSGVLQQQTYSRGSLAAAVNGTGTWDQCWLNNPTAGASAGISCAHADSSSIDWPDGLIRYVVFGLTPSNTAGVYSYTATRYNQSLTNSTLTGFTASGALSQAMNNLTGAAIGTGSGTLSKTPVWRHLTLPAPCPPRQ